jgi:hypothetical protein
VQTVALFERSIGLPKEERATGIGVTETNKSFQARAYSMAHSNLPGQTNRNGERVARCPYCVEAGGFKAMAAVDNAEGHICARCGHMAVPSNPVFECSCAKCVGIRVF